MEILTIPEIVRKAERDWTQGTTKISEYVDFSIYNTVNQIDAYLNSKHISGSTDYLGREKPFFNIVTAATNIWYRATDIDRKNITITATSEEDVVNAFLATLLLQKYMRQANFGVFLNEWGRTLARYGSAITKFVEKGGNLISEVIPWNRIICDAIDFEANPKIEKFWLTPSQLQKRIKTHGYDADYVKQIIDKHSFTTRTLANNTQTKDTKADYIPIYEIHGELPLSLLTDNEEDDETYQQQMHVVCFLEKREKGGFDDYTLFKGKEAKDPYMITHLIKEDGRTLAIGAVEHLFEAQWMVNDNMKKIKDQLELASKIIFQTADVNYIGKNALTNIENGEVLIYTQGNPLTQINNKPDIAAMQANMQQWQAIANQINGISEAMQGQNPPSGTAWRLQQALLQESHSLFELMTENKGLAIAEMITKFILPHLKKQMDTTEEISELLTEQQIKFIDERFLPAEVTRQVNQRKINTILSGQIYTPELEMQDTMQATQAVQGSLNQMGNQRFIKPSEIKTKTWKMQLEGLEWRLDIDVTNESRDKQMILQTLSTVLQTIASLRGQPMPDDMKLVLNKILSLVGGISPLELNQKAQQAPAMAQPAVAQAPVGGAPQFGQVNQQ